MTTRQTADVIKKRILAMAPSARQRPLTAGAAYAYMEAARMWACRNGCRDLIPLIREAKDSIIYMEVAA